MRKDSSNSFLFAICVFSLGITSFASAGHEDSPAMSELLSMSLNELVDIKVTGATLTSKKLRYVPSAVTVFNHKQISRMGVDTLTELMNFVPGFQSYRSTGNSYHLPFSSRGRRIGSASAEVLVLIDGQRLNDPRSGGISQILAEFSLNQIERVEFIRGPGASIYGSNAMMGVINIISRTDINELAIEAGSFSSKSGHALLSKNIGDLSFNIFAHINTDNGDTFNVPDKFSTSRVNTRDPQRTEDINLKIGWKKTQLNFQHYASEANDFIGFTGNGNGVNELESQMSLASLKQSFDWYDVSSDFSISYKETSTKVIEQQTAVGALAATSNPSSNEPFKTLTELDQNREIQAQLNNDWKIDSHNSLQFGLEYRYLDITQSLVRANYDIPAFVAGTAPITFFNTFDSSRLLQTPSERNIIGIYSQYQHEFKNGSQLTIGLRYDNFLEVGSQLSPRFGFVQPVGKHHTFKLLYGEAFRAPSEEELNLATNASIAGNKELQPEKIQTLELIWMGQWQKTSTSVGFFENRFTDSIGLASIGGTRFQFKNQSEPDHTRGIEFEFTRELGKNFILKGSYTYLNDIVGDSFREATNLASISANYQKGNWNTNLSTIFHGERDALIPNGSTVVLDSYWLAYGKLQYDINKELQSYLQIKNIFNNGYATPSANKNLAENVPNRGREFTLGLNWNF